MKQRVVFLDRDGTLTKRAHLTWKKSQLALQSGAASFVRFLNKKKIPVIVITNQPVVARGLITEMGVRKLHKEVDRMLVAKKAFIDAYYVCPHHPEATLKKYRKVCNCRKPKIGMLKDAAKDFSIDLKKSFMIGDMTQDILAGKNAKMISILLEKGHAGKDGKYKVRPNHRAKNFMEIKKIIQSYAI